VPLKLEYALVGKTVNEQSDLIEKEIEKMDFEHNNNKTNNTKKDVALDQKDKDSKESRIDKNGKNSAEITTTKSEKEKQSEKEEILNTNEKENVDLTTTLFLKNVSFQTKQEDLLQIFKKHDNSLKAVNLIKSKKLEHQHTG